MKLDKIINDAEAPTNRLVEALIPVYKQFDSRDIKHLVNLISEFIEYANDKIPFLDDDIKVIVTNSEAIHYDENGSIESIQLVKRKDQ